MKRFQEARTQKHPNSKEEVGETNNMRRQQSKSREKQTETLNTSEQTPKSQASCGTILDRSNPQNDCAKQSCQIIKRSQQKLDQLTNIEYF